MGATRFAKRIGYPALTCLASVPTYQPPFLWIQEVPLHCSPNSAFGEDLERKEVRLFPGKWKERWCQGRWLEGRAEGADLLVIDPFFTPSQDFVPWELLVAFQGLGPQSEDLPSRP